MPVRKFSSVEALDAPHWYEPGDPALYRALRRVWALHARTLQPRFPPGVHRHRSLAEMNALQERWDEANFLAHRERMSHPPLDAGSEPAAPEIDAAGVDRAQIRAMLELSPEERLRVLEEFLDSVRAIRSFNEAGRIR